MIDGIKAILTHNLDTIRQNPLLDFQTSFNTSVSTGEIKSEKKQHPIAKYKSLIFEDKGTVIEVRGSIHKMSNDGKHNYDQFGLSRIHVALYELADQLSIVTNHAELKNIEFRVNLLIDYEPRQFINSVIFHKGKKFTYRKERKWEYRECSHCQYYIKIYDKGLQNNLKKYILRIELKYIKMEKIHDLGIKYISDLLSNAKLEKLKSELLSVFDEILIGDMTFKAEGLSLKEQVLFEKGHSDNFWDANLPKTQNYKDGAQDRKYRADKTFFYREMDRFRNLLSITGADSKKKNVRNLIEIECSNLLRNANDKLGKKGKCVKLTTKHKSTIDEKMCQIDQPEEVNKLCQIDPLLYSDNSIHLNDRQKRKCVVTGLDISMQKDDSIYLCTTGVKYYMKNNPKVFAELKKRLSRKWNDSPLDKQIEEIHHSIRNEHFNKKHNNRRNIQKVLSQPALFNQIDLISKERLQLAELAS